MKKADGGQFCVDKICRGCGRKFFIPRTNFWGWKKKRNGKYVFFCSYNCFNRKDVKPAGKRRTDGEKIELLSLRAIRQHFGYTREEISDYLGIKTATYRHYENSSGAPSPERLNRLACGFGCTPDDLIAAEFDPGKAAEWNCTIPHIEENSEK